MKKQFLALFFSLFLFVSPVWLYFYVLRDCTFSFLASSCPVGYWFEVPLFLTCAAVTFFGAFSTLLVANLIVD